MPSPNTILLNRPLCILHQTYALLNSKHPAINSDQLRLIASVARELSEGKRLFILFDELFKGTNVKDAFDATLTVTQKLAQYYDCAFVISTHIIEVGNELTSESNIRFQYMPTLMEGVIPRYTYRLTEGITSDRQGMIIIENEKILDMFD